MSPSRAALLILGIGLGLACGRGRTDPVVRTDSAGIEIVAVTSPFRALGWQADTVLLLGGEEEGPEGFYQVRAQLVDVAAGGAIAVLDPSRHRVMLFDTAGAFLRELGREGEGPGEFRAPLGVAISDRGEVRVHDASRGVLVGFSLEGAILPQEPYPFATITNRLRHVELIPSGTVLWGRDRFGGSDRRFERLLRISAGDTAELVAAKPAYRTTASYPECGMTFTVQVPLSPSLHWSQWSDRIAVALWGEDRVDVFDGLHLTRSLRLAPAEPALSEADAIRVLEEYGARGPCNATPREMVRKHGFYPRPQRILGLAVGPDGAIWVRRRVGDRDSRIAVFDSAGAPVGVLPRDFPMPLNFLPDGRPLISVRDSLDVERIGILHLRLTPGQARPGS